MWPLSGINVKECGGEQNDRNTMGSSLSPHFSDPYKSDNLPQ
jgi:hypothetical protein